MPAMMKILPDPIADTPPAVADQGADLKGKSSSSNESSFNDVLHSEMKSGDTASSQKSGNDRQQDAKSDDDRHSNAAKTKEKDSEAATTNDALNANAQTAQQATPETESKTDSFLNVVSGARNYQATLKSAKNQDEKAVEGKEQSTKPGFAVTQPDEDGADPLNKQASGQKHIELTGQQATSTQQQQKPLDQISPVKGSGESEQQSKTVETLIASQVKDGKATDAKPAGDQEPDQLGTGKVAGQTVISPEPAKQGDIDTKGKLTGVDAKDIKSTGTGQDKGAAIHKYVDPDAQIDKAGTASVNKVESLNDESTEDDSLLTQTVSKGEVTEKSSDKSGDKVSDKSSVLTSNAQTRTNASQSANAQTGTQPLAQQTMTASEDKTDAAKDALLSSSDSTIKDTPKNDQTIFSADKSQQTVSNGDKAGNQDQSQGENHQSGQSSEQILAEQNVAEEATDQQQFASMMSDKPRQGTETTPVNNPAVNRMQAVENASAVKHQQQLQAQQQENAMNEAERLANEPMSVKKGEFAVAAHERVMLMNSNGVKSADIRLDPADLGRMQIKVNQEGDQVSVSFVVQNSQAKEMLESALPKLREMMAENGIEMGEGSVDQEKGGNDRYAETETGAHGDGRQKQATGYESSTTTSEAEIDSAVMSSLRLSGGTVGGIDYFA